MANAFEIAQRLSGTARPSRAGSGWLTFCPCHQNTRTPSLSIADGERGLIVRCWGARCDSRDILAELRRRGLLPPRGDPSQPPPRPLVRRRPVGTPDQRRAEAVDRIWREACDPRGTLGEGYVNGRGLVLSPDLCGRVLRFHAACPWEDRRVPMLLAAFRPIRNDPGEEAAPVALLRIAFDPASGARLGKKMLGPVGGACIKLDADEDVSEGLGLAEGLETAMAIRAAGWRPIWCTGSAGAMRDFPVLSGIEAITCFADHDENGVGQAAARACAERWAEAGCEATITHPRSVGADWLDDLA